MPGLPLSWRLSGFYLFYFAVLGALLPYWGLYLKFLGFAPARIGELLAITLATKVIAPNLWGWVADRSGRPLAVIRLACLLAAVSFAGVYPAGRSLVGLALVMLLFSFFWNASLPLFEATTLNHLGENAHRYGRIRLWGSVGFIAATLLAGLLVQALGITVVPAVLLALLLALWLNSLLVPPAGTRRHPREAGSIGRVLRRRPVAALLLVCFLNQASHGPYYGFFSIYLEDIGYSRSLIGLLWGLGVMAEIGLFLLVPRLLPRFGPQPLLVTVMAVTTLRWLLIGGFAASLPVLLFAQTLHAFSFGVYHAVAIYLIHRFFTGPHQSRGQALYSSLSFGAGGALGNLAAGYLWGGLGPELTYALAAGVSAVGLWVAWRGLRGV